MSTVFHKTGQALYTALIAGCCVTCLAAPPSKPGVTWRLNADFSDEFEGASLDQNKWSTQYTFWSGRDPGIFDPANVSVAGGELLLDVELPPAGSLPPNKTYTVASANSFSSNPNVRDQRPLYGYFEVRAKGMDARTTSAFWIHGSSSDYWTEIDIIELFLQQPRKMPTNLHRFREHGQFLVGPGQSIPDPLQIDFAAAGIPAGETYYNSYHTYGVDWNKDTIDFYLDDVLVRSVINEHFHHPMGISITNAIQDFHGVPTGPELDAANPFQVDYIRVYDSERRNDFWHPGFEDYGSGGTTDASSWSDASRPWLARSNEQVHSGNWAMKVDNSLPNDSGQWKELRPDDPHEVRPGREMEQSLWVLITEALPTDTAKDLRFIARWNSQIAGATIQTFDLHSIPLNEWTKLETNFVVPQTDSTGAAVMSADIIFSIDNGNGGALDGTLFYDDAFFGASGNGDFNFDGRADGLDFLKWQRGESPNPNSAADLAEWQAGYGSGTSAVAANRLVPEPHGVVLVSLGAIWGLCGHRTLKRRSKITCRDVFQYTFATQ